MLQFPLHQSKTGTPRGEEGNSSGRFRGSLVSFPFLVGSGNGNANLGVSENELCFYLFHPGRDSQPEMMHGLSGLVRSGSGPYRLVRIWPDGTHRRKSLAMLSKFCTSTPFFHRRSSPCREACRLGSAESLRRTPFKPFRSTLERRRAALL